MSALGDLLEKIHSAHRSLDSVQGTLREWRDESRVSRLAIDHWPDEAGENRRRPAEKQVEQLIDFKLALPDRVRLETRFPDSEPNSIVVCDGSRCATWVADWGAEVEDQDQRNVGWILGTPGRLLDPSWLLGFLELDAARRTTHNGKPVLLAVGRPRYPLPWPFGPADGHALVVDAERGTVIRMAGLRRRTEAFVHELVELEHDVTFDERSFALSATGIVSGLGLREATSFVGFRLWALPRPVLDVTYRPGPLESVTLTYGDATVVLTQASIRQAHVSVGEPEEIEAAGRTYWLTPREVVFADDGTLIRLSHATATGAELLDIAEALVPLP